MKITYRLSDRTKNKLSNLKYQAQLKLTLCNLGFLGICAVVVAIGVAPAVALAHTFP